MINLRYQIVTTVIIFLTLGIGILIGSSVIGQERLVAEQRSLINRLEEDFGRLRSRNDHFKSRIQTLHQKLEEQTEFQQLILPLAVKDRLTDSKVLITHSAKLSTTNLERLEELFTLAGCQQFKVLKLADLADHTADLDYDYLIYLGQQDSSTTDQLSKQYQQQVNQISQLSLSTLDSKEELVKYLLELSKSRRVDDE
ncbi:MAG: copper transporter [Bacillota bacterium]